LLEILKPFDTEQQLIWRTLKDPTWDKIKKELNQSAYNVVHYHGRGAFGRLCSRCGYVTSSTAVRRCKNCGEDIEDTELKSYLFPGVDPIVPPISAEEFSTALSGSETELVVLDANSSATISGSSAFDGIATNLIRTNVPAVMALQSVMKRKARAVFIRHFYQGIVNEEAVPEAVNSGRRAIFKNTTLDWFKPVIYMHTDSRYGDLHYVSALRNYEHTGGKEQMTPPIPKRFKEIQEASLERLYEEYKAVHNQLGYTLGEVEKTRLRRQAEQIEREIKELEETIHKLDSEVSTEDTEESHQPKLIQITILLNRHFNHEELRTLCFRLGVEYDDLPAEGRANKARELVKLLDRESRILELIVLCKALRPNVTWNEQSNR
jgi:hypothetical protein